MRQQQRQFFLIIGITALVIVVVNMLNRTVIQPTVTPIKEATATAQAFWATVQAGTGEQSKFWQGLTITTLPYAPDGMQIEIVRVDGDAWPLVHLENQFNKEPPSDKRMLMLTIRATNVAANEAVYIMGSRFRLIDEQRQPYTTFHEETRCGVIPQELSGEIARGQSLTGNICTIVPRSSQQFILEYRPHGALDEIYFYVPTPTPAP